jgi:pantoate--beta-alanine ligase
MEVLTTVEQFRQAKSKFRGSWGFVPTMGYLHAGHLSLVKRAKAENDHVAVSIFVNPTQFGPNEDFAAYPRDLNRDLELLRPHSVELVFNPTPDEMYPPHFQTNVTVEEVTKYLEGAARPGHFKGVATIVIKLFNSVQADRAYFGQKDAQQTIVIRRMVADLNLPIEIVICPTIREPDGLALSSRNTYLDTAARQAATVLYRALSTAKAAFEKGERSGEALRSIMQRVLDAEPQAKPEYVSAADPITLQELTLIAESQGILLSMAVRVGKPRLIDNFLYENGQWLTGEFAKSN